MNLKLDELIAQAMQLSAEDRRQLAELLAQSTVFQAREAAVPYDASEAMTKYPAHNEPGMTAVTVVLPDDLAKQAQAAGLLGEKSLEELIRRALQEQSTSGPSNARQRRRLVRQGGRLVVEALPGEQSITDTQIGNLLNKMEW